MRRLALAAALSIPCLAGAELDPEAMAGVTPLAEWQSGEPIPVGTKDRRGPLAPGVTFWPIGYAHLSNSETPDMFMGTDRFSHPSAILLYRSAGHNSETGAPVFHSPERITAPFGSESGAIILEDHSGIVRGIWFEKGALHFSEFDEAKLAFTESDRTIAVTGLPRSPSSMWAIPLSGADGPAAAGAPSGGRWLYVFGIGDGKSHRPEGPNWRQPDYIPYDGRGSYRGVLNEFEFHGVTVDANGVAESLGEISPGEFATMMSNDAITDIRLDKSRAGDLMSGTKLGGIYYFPAEWKVTANGPLATYPKRLRAVDAEGNAIRFPSVHAYVSAYPNGKTGLDDMLIGTQGFTMHYKFGGEFSKRGEPIFEEPQIVEVENATLQLGALAVPNLVDWDGDGVTDIVAGNSDGYVLFSRNAGTNEKPLMLPGVHIQADGHNIHVQPGYYDIQGPGEARWGYSCPTTIDWDGDGDTDIVMSDPTAHHTVFINEAGPGKKPELAAGSHLYREHLDLHGTWRVRPAAGDLGGEMSYIILDDDNELHRYARLDDYNVEDRGKLRLANGKAISGAYLSAGGTGRLKLMLYDWDEDGVTDIITGTSRHASVGDPDNGLPQALGRPGSSVLWLRNSGTNSDPVLEWPRVMAFRGEPIFFGQHSCAPAIGNIGPAGRENMIVGAEDGRVWFFDRDDLSFLDAEQFAAANRSVVFDRIMANPDKISDSDGEWFSLRNVSDSAVDISRWWLYSRGAKQSLRGKDVDSVLEPGQSFVLGRSTDRAKNGGVAVDLVLDGSIGLGNDAGIIGLYSSIGVHDAVRWGAKSDALMKSDISGGDLIHGVAADLCREIGGAMGPGEIREARPNKEVAKRQ